MIKYKKSKKILNGSVLFRKILRISNRNRSISTAATVSLIEGSISEISGFSTNNLTSFKLAGILASYVRDPGIAHALFSGFQGRHDLSTYSVIIPILGRCGSHIKLVSLFSKIISSSSNGDLGCELLDVFDLLARWYGDKQRWMHLASASLIKAYADCNKPKEAIAAFYRLGNLGLVRSRSRSSCNFLLNFVAEKGDLEMVRAVFDHMKSFGVSSDVYACTILIKAYCRRKEIEKASEVWLKMEAEAGMKRDLITHTTFITGLCEHKGPDSAFSLVKQIISQGVRVDCVAYNRVIFGFYKNKRLREAEQVLEHMAMHNVAPDASSYRYLIKGYCDGRNLDRALDLHREMELKGIRTNPVIQSFILNLLCEEDMNSQALKQFQGLKDSGQYVDEVLYSIAIKAHCNMKNMEDAMQLFEEMKCRRLVLDKKLYTSLICGYCKVNQVYNARKVLSDMLEINVEPDLVTYNVLARGFCRNRLLEEADELIGFMENRGMEVDDLTYSTYIENLCKDDKLKKAKELYDAQKQEGHRQCFLHSAMISGYLTCGHTNDAYTLFYKLSKQGSLVDEDVDSKRKMQRVLHELIIKLCKEGEVERASKVLKVMLEMNAISDDISCKISYTYIIAGYSHVKDMKNARAFFENFVKRGFSPDVTVYTTLMDGYWKVGQKEKALEMFAEMVEKGIKPDETAYTVMLDGCLKYTLHKDRLHMDVETRKHEFRGWSLDVLDVLDRLKKGEFEPDDVFYTVLIDGHFKIGNVQAAEQHFNEMIRRGLMRDAFPYTALINGYTKIGNVQEAQQHFNEMIRRGLMPNAFSYTALINGYVAEGKESEAATLLGEMLDKGIKPDTCTLTTLLLKLQKQTAVA